MKLRRVITSYLEKLLPIKSLDPFIMQSKRDHWKSYQNTYSHQTLQGGHTQLGVHITKSSHHSAADLFSQMTNF